MVYAKFLQMIVHSTQAQVDMQPFVCLWCGADAKTVLFALPDGSKEAVGLVAVRPQAHEAAAGLAAAAQAGGFGHLELGQQFARIQRLKIAVGLGEGFGNGLVFLRQHAAGGIDQSPQALEELVAKQTAILQSAARLLKSGGRLIYATCSVLREENEAIAEAFGAANPDFKPLPAADLLDGLKVDGAAALCAGGEDQRLYLRLWPHRHSTDGFFAAVWSRA